MKTRQFYNFLMPATGCLAAVIPALGQQPVVPPPAVPVAATVVTINRSAGVQGDPHVSQNLVSYTDNPSAQLRYYNFATSTDLAINNVMPTGEVTFDYLSDVYNTNVVFNRVWSPGADIELFDTVSGTLTTFDPTTSPYRQTPAIGGNTIAYIDNGFSRRGDLRARAQYDR
jgi:hypothetical protein